MHPQPRAPPCYHCHKMTAIMSKIFLAAVFVQWGVVVHLFNVKAYVLNKSCQEVNNTLFLLVGPSGRHFWVNKHSWTTEKDSKVISVGLLIQWACSFIASIVSPACYTPAETTAPPTNYQVKRSFKSIFYGYFFFNPVHNLQSLARTSSLQHGQVDNQSKWSKIDWKHDQPLRKII